MKTIQEKSKIQYVQQYTHFKNEIKPDRYIYQTIAINYPKSKLEHPYDYIEALDTESEKNIKIYKDSEGYIHNEAENPDVLVVYKALYGSNNVYARPLEMFSGTVDKSKYPNIKQKFRFQLKES